MQTTTNRSLWGPNRKTGGSCERSGGQPCDFESKPDQEPDRKTLKCSRGHCRISQQGQERGKSPSRLRGPVRFEGSGIEAGNVHIRKESVFHGEAGNT